MRRLPQDGSDWSRWTKLKFDHRILLNQTIKVSRGAISKQSQMSKIPWHGLEEWKAFAICAWPVKLDQALCSINFQRKQLVITSDSTKWQYHSMPLTEIWSRLKVICATKNELNNKGKARPEVGCTPDPKIDFWTLTTAVDCWNEALSNENTTAKFRLATLRAKKTPCVKRK